MNRRTISYTYDGDTFVGRYGINRDEREPSVSVQFGHATASARLGSQPELQVARDLLGRLVRETLVTGPTPGRPTLDGAQAVSH